MMVFRKRGGGLEIKMAPIGLVAFLVFLALGSASAVPAVMGGGPYNSGHRHLIERRLDNLKASLAAVPSSSPGSSPKGSTEASNARVYHVTSYGADPTGSTDSTDAINKAISDAFKAPSDRTLMAGIADLGGAEVHLDGGTYLINSPLTLPSSGGGNFRITGGSLRASDDFPTDRYLIELNSDSSSSSFLYEYITLKDLLLDSNYRGGGIAVVNSLRTTIDNCYIAHFMSDGIKVQGGHETYIRNCFLGQHITTGHDPVERNFTGTGINLMGPDNAVTDTVIFSAATGIMVTGQANTISGVHCYNKATGFGGVGIHLKTPGLIQTRIINCYMDYTSIVSEDPVLLHISGCYFLADANVVLRSVKGVIKAVNIVDNIFSGQGGGVDIVQLDESAGKFTTVDQVIVQGNVAQGMVVKSTSAISSIEGNGTTTWTVDFSSMLLFPDRIGHVQYSFHADSSFPSHALRNTTGNQVTIVSDIPVSAKVHVAVDQNGG
ncbi:hypothetical protein LUZ61_002227 [Rhynchospora tenuis]|uniref:Rhamnogalacturonase A/B/Epimerase-like pectate lyase domain-containing protein n=1 Tax=Rhynchospora tenuis TaxID=198213 RepID=A0AAD5ZIH0_9POAL|nr:hypothetical protein LUZ61_002227 [Rhynchospora tenuis]